MIASVKKSGNALSLLGIILLVAVLLLISLLGRPAVLSFFGIPKVDSTVLFISRMLHWLALGLLFCYCIWIEKKPLLLWKDRPYNLGLMFVSLLAVFGAIFILTLFVNILLALAGLLKTSEQLQRLVAIFRGNYLLILFTSVTAGVVEELMMRGYVQPRLEQMLKSPVLAILISSLLFGLLHYGYGTIVNMVGPFVIGLVFATYYHLFRNIKLIIICHVLWDIMVLFIAVKRH